MRTRLALGLGLGGLVTALGACGNARTTESAARSAPVTFGAVLEKSAPAAAPAYAPAAAARLTYGRDVTLTSVKVVLAGINLAAMGEMGGRMADDATGPGRLRASKKNEGDGMMGGRDGDARVRNVDAVDFPGPFVWDLTNRTVTPALEPVSLPTGTYHRLDLLFSPLTAGAAQGMGLDVSDPVVGHSYLVEGYLNHVTYATVTDGTVKLRIYGDQARTFHVPLHHGLDVTPGGVNDVLLAFGVEGWFPSSLVGQLRAGLQTGGVTVDTTGSEPVVVLDATRNAAVAAQFHKLFHAAMRVAKDENGDGELSGDEPADDIPSGE